MTNPAESEPLLARQAVRESGFAGRVPVQGFDIVKDPWRVAFDVVLVSNVLHEQGISENRAVMSSA